MFSICFYNKMDCLNVMVSLLLIAGGSAFDPFACGLGGLCECTWMLGNSSGLKMNCSRKGFSNICAICNSSDMPNVTYLDVSGNMISSVESIDCIHGCQGLRFLDMHGNKITACSKDVFEIMPRLIYLDLSFNKLNIYTNTSGALFKGLGLLNTLKIYGNIDIQTYDKSYSYPDLNHLTALVNLSMDGLRDSTFNSSFKSLTNLTGLFLSGNVGRCDLGQLNNDTFQNLSRVEVLDLSNCNISNIDLLTFALPNLRLLDLSYNRQLGFETLHNVSYGLQFSKIQLFDYSFVYNTFGLGTVLRKHHVCYFRNTTLQSALLNGNRLNEVETNALMLLPNTLTTLSVQFNEFTIGQYILQLGCMPNMTNYDGSNMYMKQDGNPLVYFKEPRYPPNIDVYKDSRDCPYMEDEYLKNISKGIDGCVYLEDGKRPILPIELPITTKSAKFVNSKMTFEFNLFSSTPVRSSIEILNMSDNFFTRWNGPVPSFKSLKTFDLSRNLCTKISSNFLNKLQNLVAFFANQNFIGLSKGNFEFAFQNLSNLQQLELADNKISDMPPRSFYGLVSLETLDLSYNLLREWTLNVETLTNLTNVSLSWNFLESLPDYLTSHLMKVSQRRQTPFYVDLRYNYLKYSCKYQSFLKWVVEHKHNLIDFYEYQFIDEDGSRIPASEIESKVDQLQSKCRSYTVWIVLSTVGVTLSVSVIVGGLVYRNRWKLRYIMYMSKQRFYGYARVPNTEQTENFKYNAFISYTEDDRRFVRDESIPNLEQDGVCLCIHDRDFLPGKPIGDNILDAIQSSRKTVVLLTKAFLKSKWCMYEFNMARMENMYSRDERGCLVVVMLESVPAKDMSLEMLNFIRRESYIEYTREPEGQIVFWDKLKTAINDNGTV